MEPTSFRPLRETSALAAGILGLCFVIAAAIAAYAFYSVHTLNNTLTVTGSAKQDATADSAKWTIDVTRSTTEAGLSDAQAHVVSDSDQVARFFADAAIASTSIDTSPIFIDKDYSSDPKQPQRFSVHDSVTVQSDSPELIQKLSKDISSLSARGVFFSAHPPEYYLSTLPDIRIGLTGKAVEDAKKRAEQIAKSTGRSVGPLQSASGGVVQVLAPNSVDVADYGSYDTSTIKKTVTVSSRATFYLR